MVKTLITEFRIEMLNLLLNKEAYEKLKTTIKKTGDIGVPPVKKFLITFSWC
jgi:hypothetical protein